MSIDGWIESQNGNWVLISDGDLRGTVYRNNRGLWGAIWNAPDRSRLMTQTFDYPGEAQEAIERAETHGVINENLWWPEDGWTKSKIGSFYRRIDGAVVSVKQAKSKSWYAVTSCGRVLGKQGRPAWFPTAEEGIAAVMAYTAGSGDWEWIGQH
jgi:hypothetical protein